MYNAFWCVPCLDDMAPSRSHASDFTGSRRPAFWYQLTADSDEDASVSDTSESLSRRGRLRATSELHGSVGGSVVGAVGKRGICRWVTKLHSCIPDMYGPAECSPFLPSLVPSGTSDLSRIAGRQETDPAEDERARDRQARSIPPFHGQQNPSAVFVDVLGIETWGFRVVKIWTGNGEISGRIQWPISSSIVF